MIAADIGDLRRDDELERVVGDHHPRHAGRQAIDLRIVFLAAGLGDVEIGLEHGLVFRRERRLLAQARGLGRIPLGGARPHPGAADVGISRILLGVVVLGCVEGERSGRRGAERRRQEDCTKRASVTHEHPFTVSAACRGAGPAAWSAYIRAFWHGKPNSVSRTSPARFFRKMVHGGGEKSPPCRRQLPRCSGGLPGSETPAQKHQRRRSMSAAAGLFPPTGSSRPAKAVAN